MTPSFPSRRSSDLGSRIAPAIVESCPTRIFLPNERAAEPQIARIFERFGLNDRQIEILSRATPKRDYYCQSRRGNRLRSEEHTSELQSLMRISYAVFCLKKKTNKHSYAPNK